MLKFIRKIRQILLSEGKTGKYMKYAFGEILLIIIGIIIALQINNWNEIRITQNRVNNRLTSLIKDIKTEIEEMDGIIDASGRRVSIIHEIMKRNNKLESINWPDTLEKSTYGTYKFNNNTNHYLSFLPTFDGNRPTFEELLNSGELYTIKNKALAKKILDYYRQIDELKDQDRWGALESYFMVLRSKHRLGLSVSSKATIKTLTELANNDKQFNAELQTQLRYDDQQLRGVNNLKEKATELIKSIDYILK